MEYSYFDDSNYTTICEDCNKIHDINLIHYCPYHNECFKNEHKICNKCSDCLIFKDGYTDKYIDLEIRKKYNTCSECLNKIKECNEFILINFHCNNCNKDHDKDKIYYCPIENECFIYKHEYCLIDEKCKSELDIHCLECNKCHNITQTIYCFGCNYCFDYKHKLCTNCNKCISISGKKNTNKTICEGCEYEYNRLKINELKEIHCTSDNCNILHDKNSIYNKCLYCNKCYLYPNKCYKNHNQINDIITMQIKDNYKCTNCNLIHKKLKINQYYTYCNQCKKCYLDINDCPHHNAIYCINCNKSHNRKYLCN